MDKVQDRRIKEGGKLQRVRRSKENKVCQIYE